MLAKKLAVLAGLAALLMPAVASADLPCKSFSKGSKIVFPSGLEEVSGLAVSKTNSKYIWAHVDSGGKPELYLVDHSGKLVHTYTVAGVKNIDWEDIAVGPCENGSTKTCIYVADTGDNTFKRTDKKILVVEEPDLSWGLPSGDRSTLSLKTSYPVVYPSTSSKEAKFINPDCESVMVHPKTGDIYVVSKQSSGGEQSLYRVPRKNDGSKLELLASKKIKGGLGLFLDIYNATTGADFAPDGKHFAVRTYAGTYEYDLIKYPNIADAFRNPDRRFKTTEIQGEAVAYDADGVSLITSGEDFQKYFIHTKASMHMYTCKLAKKTRMLGDETMMSINLDFNEDELKPADLGINPADYVIDLSDPDIDPEDIMILSGDVADDSYSASEVNSDLPEAIVPNLKSDAADADSAVDPSDSACQGAPLSANHSSSGLMLVGVMLGGALLLRRRRSNRA